MSYVYDIKNKVMIKRENFDPGLQELARFARVISHPARLAILKYLAETRTCISGDISGMIPLSRSTVSQHRSALAWGVKRQKASSRKRARSSALAHSA